MNDAKYIEFAESVPLRGKTKVWSVLSKDQQACIGIIKWFGSWRCYSFFPKHETVFERCCLRDIAEFCEQETKRQWEEAKRRRQAKEPTP